MNSFAENLFSPLGREYCSYFYWLTVIAFIFLLLALYNSLMLLLKGKFKFMSFIMSLMGPFLIYFVNRLLYSMCNSSLTNVVNHQVRVVEGAGQRIA
jgi:hypothetical protein